MASPAPAPAPTSESKQPFATLYTTVRFLHARVTKTLAAAAINGLEIAIAPEFQYGITNKTSSYLSKFPMGKIPALETASGFCVAEATAIAFFVADSGPKREQLLGKTVEERAKVQMWIAFADSELWLSQTAVLGPIMGLGHFSPEHSADEETRFTRTINRLELHLSEEGRQWLVDDEISLADLSVASSLLWPLKNFVDRDWRDKLPNTIAWWERLMSNEDVGKAFLAPVPMCEKRLGVGEGIRVAKKAAEDMNVMEPKPQAEEARNNAADA